MAQLSVQHAAPTHLRGRRFRSRYLVASAAILALLSLLPPPGGCQLSYAAFHLRFTLPALALLYALARPFLTPLDHAKLIMLPAIAFVWTTPWDNEIVRQGAWTYPPSCVLAKVGYVPVEEYVFFIIQSLIQTLLSTLLLRWGSPATPKPHIRLLFLLPVLVFVLGAINVKPGTHRYYASMIAWWAAVPLALLWWGVQGAWSATSRSRKLVYATTWLAPSAALCAADIFAMRRGTWHITEATSLNIFPVAGLPIEEGAFFLVTNLILLSASLAFDTCVLHLRNAHASDVSPLSPAYFPLNARTIVQLWSAFIASPRAELSAADEDAATAERVLKRASASFAGAARLLPWDIRRDLTCLYALCRAADDAIDDAPVEGDEGKEQRKRLELLKQLVSIVFGAQETQSGTDERLRSSVSAVIHAYAQAGKASTSTLDMQRLEELRACAAACLSLRALLPVELWHELLRGYEVDVGLGSSGTGQVFTRDAELIDYSQCVAGVVGEMCVRVVLGRSGRLVPTSLRVSRDVDASPPSEELELLLWQARRMGVALQLVNIARDVVGDALQLKRCYLVLPGADAWMMHALAAGKVQLFNDLERVEKEEPIPTPAQLRPHILALLQRAQRLYEAAEPALADLPLSPARAGLRAACAVYFRIADCIRAQEPAQWGVGQRARVGKWERARVAAIAVYAGP